MNVLDTNDIFELRAAIRKTGAKLVIIDALVDTIRSQKENVENSSAIMASALHELRTIAEDLECAILLIHHEGKMGGYRGSSAIEGAVDLLLTLKGEANSDHLEFDLAAARDVKSFGFAADIDFLDGLMHLSASISTKQDHLTRGEMDVIKFMRKRDAPITLSELGRGVKAAGGVAAKTAENAALALVKPNRGYLQKTDENSFLYELTDKGRDAEL